MGFFSFMELGEQLGYAGLQLDCDRCQVPFVPPMPRIDFVASLMLLLIDAYNLLHHSDQMHRGRSDGWLARARERLVDTLAGKLGAELCRQTCLVFDASMARKDLPDTQVRNSIELRFAVDHDEADDLLEELIARHPTPKRLMVVSSDHRVQKAASRRGARFMDSDVWYSELVENRLRLAVSWPPEAKAADVIESDKPLALTDEAELAAWLEEFANADQVLTQPDSAAGSKWGARQRSNVVGLDAGKKDGASRPEFGPNGGEQKDVGSIGDKPDPAGDIDPELANPFPEGYGEDLLE